MKEYFTVLIFSLILAASNTLNISYSQFQREAKHISSHINSFKEDLNFLSNSRTVKNSVIYSPIANELLFEDYFKSIHSDIGCIFTANLQAKEVISHHQNNMGGPTYSELSFILNKITTNHQIASDGTITSIYNNDLFMMLPIHEIRNNFLGFSIGVENLVGTDSLVEAISIGGDGVLKFDYHIWSFFRKNLSIFIITLILSFLIILISSRKLMLLALAKSNQEVYHEIKNSNSKIMIICDTLHKDGVTRAFNKFSKYADHILRLKEYENSLLHVLMNITERSRLNIGEHDITNIVQQVIDDAKLTGLIGDNTSIHFSSKIALVKCDRLKIALLLFNLVKNASAAIGTQKGNIWIDIRDDGKIISLRITNDNGEVSFKKLIFLGKRFFSSNKEGSGLGLIVCRKIALEHGTKLKSKLSFSNNTVSFTIKLLKAE